MNEQLLTELKRLARTVRKIEDLKAALADLVLHLHPTKETEMDRDTIRKYFKRPDTELGHFLRKHNLLICSDHSFVAGNIASDNNPKRSKKYLRTNDIRLIDEMFEFAETTLAKELCKRFKHEVFVKRPDEYMDTVKGRRYHPLVYMESNLRHRVLKELGAKTSIDIESGVFSIISQIAKRNNPEIQTPNIDRYLAKKDIERNRLAELCKSDMDKMKECLTAMNYGARLTSSKIKNCIYETIGDSDGLISFINDPLVFGLRDEMKECWSNVDTTLYQSEGVKKGSYQAIFYMNQELTIIRTLEQYLMDMGISVFPIHDQIVLDTEVDNLESLVQQVIQSTLGITIPFKEVIIADDLRSSGVVPPLSINKGLIEVSSDITFISSSIMRAVFLPKDLVFAGGKLSSKETARMGVLDEDLSFEEQIIREVEREPVLTEQDELDNYLSQFK